MSIITKAIPEARRLLRWRRSRADFRASGSTHIGVSAFRHGTSPSDQPSGRNQMTATGPSPSISACTANGRNAAFTGPALPAGDDDNLHILILAVAQR